MKLNISILFLSTLLLHGAYIRDDAKEIVLDSETELIWEDSRVCSSVKREFNEAIRYCSDLNVAGYDDWRLASSNELSHLVDLKRYNPAIDKAFKYVGVDSIYDFYWSSTTNVENNESAWFIYFHHGNIETKNKDESGFVRCVRGGL